MHTSNLGSNYIEEIQVFGAPGLPELLSKPNGSLSGRVISKSGASTAGLPVEICVNSFGLFYTGNTPCSRQPFHLSTTTDKEGNFTFPELPMGVYYITFGFGGRWKYMTAGLGFVAQGYVVEAGRNTQIKDLVVD